jgi:aspartate-semialdehyde dehydrogenase
MALNVAVAGVTGAVGQEFLQILEQRKFPADNYKFLASSRSAGKAMTFMGKKYTVEEMTEKSFDGMQIGLFSAGGSISKKFAPIAAKAGCVVVDNSSAFRMEETVPLVVPEINPDDVKWNKGIIANPNCTTIIGIVPVWPLHKAFTVKRMIVSSYQAVSGAGWKAMEELKNQTRDVLAGKPAKPEVFKYACAFNCFSHNSDMQPNGYNVEEMKLVKETHKIFHDGAIRITGTCVRVPVLRAHCESINLEFEQSVNVDRIREILSKAPGVTVLDDRQNNRFPMPLDATGQDNVFVGRIRYDESIPDNRAIHLWVAGDQLRKGAALNAVQIAELLI